MITSAILRGSLLKSWYNGSPNSILTIKAPIVGGLAAEGLRAVGCRIQSGVC